MKNRFSLIFLLVLISSVSFAQQDTIRNPLSIEPIAYYEQLYKFRVSRIVDLNERQNAGFKSRQSDLARFLIDAIKSGKLNVYGDSLNRGLVQSVGTTLVSNTAVMAEAWDSKKSYLSTENVSVNGINYSSLRNDNVGHSPSDASWWEKAAEQTEYVGADQVQGL
jgi:hypothetical protein